MPLHRWTDDLWTADSELRMPMMRLPVRMTIARIDDALWVHSPIELDDALASEVAELGRVAWIVGPNTYHHLSLKPWHERWPDAELWAPAGLAAKRPGLTFAGSLTGGPLPPAWSGHIESVALEGAPKLDEVVFFHIPSKSLVCTDLVFNVQEPKGWGAWPVLKLMGTYKRFALSSFWRLLAKDRERLTASAARVLEWEIERVIMAHGDVVEDDAHRRLTDALGWLARTGSK